MLSVRCLYRGDAATDRQVRFLSDAWAAVHENTPHGWYVGRPTERALPGGAQGREK